MKRFFMACAIVAVALPLLAQQTAPKPADPPVETTGVGYGGPRPPTPTGPIPRLPDGTVDLNGAWEGGGAIGNFEREGGLKQGELTALLQPWAKKLMESRSEDDDPHNFCMPDGIGRGSPFVWRFVQNYTHKKPTHLFFIREANIHTYRQIFMDGRKHPEELDPTWMGHSIGWWEGDTLVIDTVGFNDKWWWDRRGTPHTEQLHTIERWTRKDLGHMELKLTADDPGAYTRPFVVTFQAKLAPGDEIREYICQENNQYGIAGGVLERLNKK